MKILKEMGLSDHLTCLLRKLTQVKKQQLELLLYNKTIYCHPAYLTYMQSTSCKMLSWMMHKLKLPGKIPTASGMLMLNTLNGRKQRGIKETLDESEKAGLKLTIQKSKIMTSGLITVANRRGKMEMSTDFIFMGTEITADGDYSHEIKGHLLLGRKTMTNLDSILKAETSLC